VDVIYDEAQWTQCQDAVRLMQEVFKEPGDGEGAARYKLWSAEEARERFLVKGWGMRGEGVRGAVSYEAGSISGYKFVNGVLEMCLERRLELFTHTPVTKLERSRDGWEVVAAKGSVKAKRVVVATNGYTAHLLPQFQAKIVPLRGQVTAHRPGSNMPSSGLDTTYSFIYENGYEYMIPRPPGSPFLGDIAIGGGLARARDEGLLEFGETDDSSLNTEISAYLHDTTATYFGSGWGEDDKEGRVRREWTGVMGYSPDGFPFVGEVPGMEGLWIAASFQGHGMVFCWESARALVGMMGGMEVGESFPGVFGVSEGRLGKRFEGRLHTRVAEGEMS
jgi:glycine/D-amino acid oxidase-like deaminating enzyme